VTRNAGDEDLFYGCALVVLRHHVPQILPRQERVLCAQVSIVIKIVARIIEVRRSKRAHFEEKAVEDERGVLDVGQEPSGLDQVTDHVFLAR
jgi:hypothetical protein